jgi:hypothetical protein
MRQTSQPEDPSCRENPEHARRARALEPIRLRWQPRDRRQPDGKRAGDARRAAGLG